MKLDKGEYWDKSLSPVVGCTPCSPGCDHCWARRIVERFLKSHRDKGFGYVQIKTSIMAQCVKRKKPTVYALSWLGDLFHREVPFEFIMEVFRVIKSCPQHVFLILTKRIGRMKEFVDYWYRQDEGDLPKNAWLGATVCNQREAHNAIPILVGIRCSHRWISIEPMLRPINIERASLKPDHVWADCLCDEIDPSDGPCLVCDTPRVHGIDWIVVGSESGSSARKASQNWIRSIVAQCDTYRIPCFVKQIHDENGKLVKAPWGFPLELPPELDACRD